MDGPLRDVFVAMMPRIRAQESIRQMAVLAAADPWSPAAMRQDLGRQWERESRGDNGAVQKVDVGAVLANLQGLGIPVIREPAKQEEPVVG